MNYPFTPDHCEELQVDMASPMTTVAINGKMYAGIKSANMPDVSFKSMVLRNDMTADKMNKFRGVIKRSGL